jgi:NAD+ synthase
MENALVAANIRAEFKEYLQKSGLKSIVLGISGGIDSAICVALAKPVCDELGVTIIGRFISIGSNTREEIDRAKLIGNAFCHDYEFIDFTTEYYALGYGIDKREGEIEDNDIADKIRKGNIKARTRMIYLYNLAQLHGGMVLSTDNYTELMLGFWTLHGDVGDYGMVQSLWKMEVYALSKHIANNECAPLGRESLMACVDATPTDGLGITNSDLDQLGVATYAEVDDLIRDEMLHPGQDNPVAKRLRASNFKRTNPYNIPRHIVCQGGNHE